MRPKGFKHSEETKRKIAKSHLGISHPGWNKGGHLSEETKLKISLANNGPYLQWVKQVKQRDSGVCRLQNENCKGYRIVHHILSWSEYPEERYNINNGITLCQAHHPRKREEERRLIPTLQELVGSNNH